jgi:hypothetical protein
MITPKEYLMGRDNDYPITHDLALNMADLLSRVNFLIAKLGINTVVTSGYRPPEINKKIGGATKSSHTQCKAVDLKDSSGSIGKLLINNVKLLEELGLFLESPEHTKGWVHLDTKQRKNRVFIP